MPDKQKSQPADDETVKKIDAMMAAEGADSTPAVSTDATAAKIEAPSSAPEMPGEVYKPAPTAKPPIVIKLADGEPDDAQPVPVKSNEPPAEETPADDQAAPEPAEPTSANLEDSATDEAVDDIAAKEGDLVLAVEDARKAKKEKAAAGRPGLKARLKSLLKNKWTWAGLAVLLLIMLALPFARYPVLGLFIKKPVTITVLDSKTATPVSNAQVKLAGESAKTDGEGRAHLKAALGKKDLLVSKQYYQDSRSTYFVGFKAPKQPTTIRLVATGRLVPVTVVNTITGMPLSGVEVSVKGTNAKTNSKGQASVALPTTAASYAARLSLNGYNPADITVQVTDRVVKANSFTLTPAGHVYFLSNLSGKIDVVKANLDGTGRKTVLAGTGHEDQADTSLLASRDWHYLVLKAHRDSQAALYLIDTSSDKATTIDSSAADFNLVGWYGHAFVYDLTRQNQPNWQPGREQLKSYDADNLQLNQLDQNQAEGAAGNYAYQYFGNFYILNGTVAYTTQWSFFNPSPDYTGKNFTIRAVQPNGQNKRDYQTLPAATTSYIQANLYSPQAVYYAVSDNTGKTTYYQFENQAVKPASIDNGSFNQPYPTFLISPSGNATFWTELRDGKNSLFTGDADASNKKQIASLSAYSPYGWFSDNYVLVSKNNSELYVMSANGQSNPVKVTDYYKPARAFNGYGYGYGGL